MSPRSSRTSSSPALSASTRRVLQQADRAITSSPRGDPVPVYAACRVAMECLAPVDTFYVALIRQQDQTTSLPYTFDGGVRLVPDVLPFGPRGLTAWMQASQRTYRYRDDGGALIGKGHAFGDPIEQDHDAIVTPLFASPDGQISGFMAVLSVRSAVFTQEHVAAFEWLSKAAGLALSGHETARTVLDLSAVYAGSELDGAANQPEMANHVIAELEQMRAQLLALHHQQPALVEDLRARCEALQTTVAVLVGRPTRDPLQSLTQREREVVELITGPTTPGNRAIAVTLGLSEATVKTHVAHALAKLGLKRRSEIRWLLGHPDGRSR